MSLLAFFYLIDADKLPQLVSFPAPAVKKKWFGKWEVTDEYHDYLTANSILLYGAGPNDLNGAVFYEIHSYLQDEYGLTLDENEYKEISKEITQKRSMDTLILNRTSRERFEALDLGSQTNEESEAIGRKLFDEEDEDAAYYFRRGLSVLGEALEHVDGDRVVILEFA